MTEQRGDSHRSRRAARKEHILELLARRDKTELISWIENDPNPASVLVSLLFISDDVLRWRAIETLGQLIGRRAKENPEIVRDYLRRLFWSMNYESGNLIWNAPEAIGEILANAPNLVHEYATQLLSFLRQEPFERGTHWAVARLAALSPAAFTESTDVLLDSLTDPDPKIRAYALIAVNALGLDPEGKRIESRVDDSAVVHMYDFDTGELRETTVAQIAQAVCAAVEEHSPAVR